MRVLITGATGFVGRALVARLLREGHEIVALVRDPASASASLGAEVALLDAGVGDDQLAAAMADIDGVVNLAGEGLFGRRWSAARRRALVDSRVELTRRLVGAMAAAGARRPEVLISASGIGYYGDRGADPLDEQSVAGEDFLAGLSRAWEEAARGAEALGARVALLRIATVLGPEGGALQRLEPLFRRGLGGRLGSGRQYMPWIHLQDLLEVIACALVDPRYRGPINATAPEQITNRDFTRALAEALGRSARLAVPAALLRLTVGGAAEVLVASQRAAPAALLRLEHPFRHPTLREALAEIYNPSRLPSIGPADGEASGGDGADGGKTPRHLLYQAIVLDAPLERVFPFFARPQNLGLLTPPWMDFSILGDPPALPAAGTTIDYRIKLGPLPTRWRTLITAWEPGRRFVDTQARGPYRLWRHEHTFQALPDGTTLMEDRVAYALPLGLLGRLVHRLFVAPLLRRIFAYRSAVVALRFGLPGPAQGGDARSAQEPITASRWSEAPRRPAAARTASG